MKSRGRPTKGEERPTLQIRMYADQVEVLGWIKRIERKSTAQLIDSLMGDKLYRLFAAHLPHIKKLKATEDEIRKDRGETPTPPLPVVEVSSDGKWVSVQSGTDGPVVHGAINVEADAPEPKPAEKPTKAKRGARTRKS